MPKADNKYTPTRRQMLGALLGAAASTVVAPAIAIPHPDAALFDACKAYLALDVERKEACEIHGGNDDALEAATEVLWQELARLRDEILSMEALTIEGILARAGAYAQFTYDPIAKGYPTLDDEFLTVVLNDIRTYRTRVH